MEHQRPRAPQRVLRRIGGWRVTLQARFRTALLQTVRARFPRIRLSSIIRLNLSVNVIPFVSTGVPHEDHHGMCDRGLGFSCVSQPSLSPRAVFLDHRISEGLSALGCGGLLFALSCELLHTFHRSARATASPVLIAYSIAVLGDPGWLP